MPTSTHTVKGMTCEHCVKAVESEAGGIPGVTEVAVDLETGRLTVTSVAPVDAARLAEAVDEAGYELVS